MPKSPYPLVNITEHVFIETQSGTAYEVEPCMGIYIITRRAPTHDTSDEKVAGSWRRTCEDAYTLDFGNGPRFHAYGGSVEALRTSYVDFIAQVV